MIRMFKKNKRLRIIKMSMMSLLVIVALIGMMNKKEDISYKEDIGKYNNLNYDYVFLGDSITFRNDWEYFYPNYTLINSGIDGNKSNEVLNRLQADVYFYRPKNIVLLIGVNDISRGVEEDIIVSNVDQIIKDIKENLPNTNIYLESVYPVNNIRFNRSRSKIKNYKIVSLNEQYKLIAKRYGINYIDVYSSLLDDQGNLNIIYTKDGLHLNLQGYIAVTNVLNNYIIKEEVSSK